jgi:hypothetical protein
VVGGGVMDAKKGKSSSGKKGGKKIGRHLADCLKYKMQGRREKNKARKMAKQKRFEEKKRLEKLAA